LAEELHKTTAFSLFSDYLKPFVFTRAARQTFLLYASHLLAMALGVAAVSLNTGILGPEQYGIFTFFSTIVDFVFLFCRFGFLETGGLMVAHEGSREKTKEIIGALTVVTFLIGLVLALAIFTVSFFLDDLFKTNVNMLFRGFSPLVVILPFGQLVPQLATGTNRILALSWFGVLPRSLYIALVGFFLVVSPHTLSVRPLIFINLCTMAVVLFFIMRSFEPSFRNLGENLKGIWKRNKEYGFHLYLGQLADKSTYRLDGILISYFVNTVNLGFYNLATALASPIAMFSQALSASLFRDFASKTRLSKKIIYPNAVWLVLCTVGLIILGGTFVRILFGARFVSMTYLIAPLAITCFFQGMYQPYNMFLAAQGKGRWLKNISIGQSIFNLVGNVSLIYYMGAFGAAIASLIAAAIAYGGHLFYYRKLEKQDTGGRGVE
jgi:O-antigen/teichoic acid export membrane protein